MVNESIIINSIYAEKDSYTREEVKGIMADLIERMGCDAGAVCQWQGVDACSLEDWGRAWWEAFLDVCNFEASSAKIAERNKIIKLLQSELDGLD